MEPMVDYHRVPFSRERRRMMCLESLEVTGTSLTSSCISLCSSGYRSTHGLYEGLLIKNRWCLTSTSWATSTPSTSTCNLHKSNGKRVIKFHVHSVFQTPSVPCFPHTSITCIIHAICNTQSHTYNQSIHTKTQNACCDLILSCGLLGIFLPRP